MLWENVYINTEKIWPRSFVKHTHLIVSLFRSFTKIEMVHTISKKDKHTFTTTLKKTFTTLTDTCFHYSMYLLYVLYICYI